MPYAEHNGVRIYWEAHGTGEPIVLVMGLSFTLDMWYRLAPELATTHRVILFDNRGVGRSDIPSGTYTIGVMAEDTIAVMDAAEVADPAVLVGASMGGMIAQEVVSLSVPLASSVSHPLRQTAFSSMVCLISKPRKLYLPSKRLPETKWHGQQTSIQARPCNLTAYPNSAPLRATPAYLHATRYEKKIGTRRMIC